jgi:hypothetical protein
MQPSQLFSIACQISAILEEERSPDAERHQVGDDLSWAVDLVEVARAFRGLLIALADEEADEHIAIRRRFDSLLHSRAANADAESSDPLLKSLNSFLQKGLVTRLVLQYQRGKATFTKTVDPNHTPLAVSLANWISDYLTIYREDVDLAVCVECCRIFKRDRSDNAYCSKTCQNRVAYKRKRIFGAGVLREVQIDSEDTTALTPGLWIYYPRFALGRIENVRFSDRRLIIKVGDSGRAVSRIPEDCRCRRALQKIPLEAFQWLGGVQRP